MDELFNNILDKDEHIIKTYKPSKKRYVWINSIIALVAAVCGIIIFTTLGYFSYMDYLKGINEAPMELGIIFFVLSGLFFLSSIIYSICINITYKKTVYALSNKRVIIRSGFIGVDYQTLEMKMIGTHEVSVSLWDKCLKPNTGTIRFGSTSAPVLEKGASYSFDYLSNPYDAYKEIKEIIDDATK